jgi:hypothetical protein
MRGSPSARQVTLNRPVHRFLTGGLASAEGVIVRAEREDKLKVELR